MITFKDVSKVFKQKTVLEKQSFEIKDHEFLVLVGPSGSGKTTILKMINRLVEMTEGEIFIDGICQSNLDLRQLRLSMGYVVQQIALFPNLTVAENIALIPKMKKWSQDTIYQKTIELLNKVGLNPEEYLDRYPRQLSGGEQQRVGIVRALIGEPRFLLMDEPFSALDPISREQLQDLLKRLHKEFSMTVIFVTHDIREAVKLADRIAVLNKGKIIQLATPQDMMTCPADPFIEELFGGLRHD